MSFERKEIQEHLTDAEIEPALEVIEYLSQCEPSKVELTNYERIAEWLAKWGLIVSLGLTILSAALALCHFKLYPLPVWVQMMSAGLSLLAIILVLLTFIIPIAASAISLICWKKSSFMNFRKEILHDAAHVTYLDRFDLAVLEESRYWVELKLSRIESRIGFFFGDKAAVFAILAIAWSCLKELGGWKWVGETFEAGFKLGNLSNTLLLWGGAFVLGISLGAALLRRVAQHYTYQKELLITVLRKKTNARLL